MSAAYFSRAVGVLPAAAALLWGGGTHYLRYLEAWASYAGKVQGSCNILWLRYPVSPGRPAFARTEQAASVAIQVLQASVIHKHPATLNTGGLHLYQFAVSWSITPFAFSRAR